MKSVYIDDLKYKSDFGTNYSKYHEGYRIVYFYPDNTYNVGTFCECIEGFMMDFVEVEPIMDDEEIPSFISIDDMLERYLADMKNITAVAIYKTDGTCIEIKERKNKNYY